jgi:hypothetical protein
MPKLLPITALLLMAWLVPAAESLIATTGTNTVLGVDGSRFTLNGKPVFLLGASYYGGLGAAEDFIRQDLVDLRRRGFNWLRVWATWASGEVDVSAVDAGGAAREPYLTRLKWLVAECDRQGMVVDVTLSRGKPRLPDFAAHQRAVETLVTALKAHRNWYLDLANEHDVRDARYVPTTEINALREQVRNLDPQRLVTASFGGDVDQALVRKALVEAGLDFLCPHRSRTPESASQTEAQTRAGLAAMRELGQVVPLVYQEPFRRGYGKWQPVAEDYLRDLRGAIAGGAAGWCFHNGQQADSPDHEPRRSFDMSRKRLFEQIDLEERRVVDDAAEVVKRAGR